MSEVTVALGFRISPFGALSLARGTNRGEGEGKEDGGIKEDEGMVKDSFLEVRVERCLVREKVLL